MNGWRAVGYLSGILLTSLLLRPLIVTAADNETRVELSIFDLIGKDHQVNKSQFDLKAYARGVAKQLRDNRNAMQNCVRDERDLPRVVSLQFSIEKDGGPKSLLMNNNGGIEKCILDVILSQKFLSHPLVQGVAVKLPIKLAMD